MGYFWKIITKILVGGIKSPTYSPPNNLVGSYEHYTFYVAACQLFLHHFFLFDPIWLKSVDYILLYRVHFIFISASLWKGDFQKLSLAQPPSKYHSLA